MIEAELQQLMMNVVLVGAEGGAPFDDALNHDAQRVEQRQREQQDRRGCADGGVARLRRTQAQHAHRKSEQLAARITHEDAGGERIEAQEPEDGPGEGQRERRADDLPPAVGQQRERSEAQKGGASRQTVEAVGKIDGVGDADQRTTR